MVRHYDFATEWPKIRDAAITFGVDAFYVAAIRVAENGRPGREFGVLSESAPSYDAQLRATCVSVRNETLRYGPNGFEYNGRFCYQRKFVDVFAKRWAPPLVVNDPHNLNANWPDDCWEAYLAFVDYGGPIAWQQHLGARA